MVNTLKILEDSLAEDERKMGIVRPPSNFEQILMGGEQPQAAQQPPAPTNAGMTGGLDPGGMMVPTEVGQGITDEDVSQAKALGVGAYQGATFDFGDEIAGLISDDWKQAIRSAEQEAMEKHPAQYYLGQGVGTVGTGLATGGSSLLGVTGSRLGLKSGLKLAGVGATEAGLADIGQQNVIGEDGKIDWNRTYWASALGSGGGIFFPMVSNVGRRTFNKFFPASKKIRQTRKTARILTDQMEAEGLRPEEFFDIKKLRENPDMKLIDISGVGAREIAKDAAKANERAAIQVRRLIDERKADQQNRIIDSISAEMGPLNSREAVQAMKQQTRAQVGPAYEALGQMSFVPSRRMVSGMERIPAMKEGLKYADELAVLGRERFDYVPEFGRPMTGKQATLVQEGLGDYLEEVSTRLPSGKLQLSKRGVRVKGLLDEIKDEMDTQMPGYRETRQRWAMSKDAEKGEEIGRMWVGGKGKMSEIKDVWNEMSPTSREFAKYGFITETVDKIKNKPVKGKLADSFDTKKNRETLELMIGKDGSDRFFDRIAVESNFDELARVIGNTRQSAMKFITRVTSPGSPVGAYFRAINIPLTGIQIGVKRKLAQDYVETMMTRNIDEMLNAVGIMNPSLRRLEAATASLARRDYGRATTVGAGAGAMYGAGAIYEAMPNMPLGGGS